jgi:hypothetical protein
MAHKMRIFASKTVPSCVKSVYSPLPVDSSKDTKESGP